MLTVTLMKWNGLSNVVDKTPSTLTSLTLSGGTIPGDFDEYSPELTLNLNGISNWTSESLSDSVNYCKVTANSGSVIDRYYFVEKVTIVNNDIIKLKCRMDVLKTYSSYIKSLQCYLSRSESDGDLYIEDKRPIRCYDLVEKKSFRNGDESVVGFSGEEHDGFYLITTLQDGWSERS